MDFDDYQEKAWATANYPEAGTGDLTYVTMGLTGEAGEVSEKVKKMIRDDGGELTEERREAIIKELSDCFWYLAAFCTELNIDMSEVAQVNLDKLSDRVKRGVICGDGDNR